MISVETSMKDYEASVPDSRRMESTDETTGVTDAGMDGFLPLGATRSQPDYTDFWGEFLL